MPYFSNPDEYPWNASERKYQGRGESGIERAFEGEGVTGGYCVEPSKTGLIEVK